MTNIYRLTGIAKFDFAISSLDNHLKISGKSIKTRKAYNSAFHIFIKYSNKLPEEFAKNELVNTIIGLQNKRGFGAAALKKYIYSIRYYLKYIAERMDLHSKIPIPSTKRYNVEILNLAELKLLFDACKNTRDIFIIQLLYETGIRIKELLNIKYQDFDLHNGTLTIRDSKNRKTRTVYFGENLKVLFKKYHNLNRSLFSQTAYNIEYHPFINLTRSGVRHMLNSAVKRSGINKRVTPHLLRHAFAVHYLNFGGKIYQLQKLLGHSSLRTTLYYLQYAVLPEWQNISILDKIIEIYSDKKLLLKRA